MRPSNAIKALIPHQAVLELYQVHAVTQGTDAQAEVSVRLAEQVTARVTATGADPDTLVASAKAYLGALKQADVPTPERHAGRGGGGASRAFDRCRLSDACKVRGANRNASRLDQVVNWPTPGGASKYLNMTKL